MVIDQFNVKIEDRDLIKSIQAGEKSAIVRGLSHPGAFYRINAMLNAVRYEIKDPVLKIYLDRMKKDKVVMDGYRVSDFAYAALDILGLERYSENDIVVRRLIASKFQF